MKRKYFKTVLTYTVLSEDEPADKSDLETIARACDSGSWVGKFNSSVVTGLSGKEMADALYEAGSEPETFELDDQGRHEDDEKD